MKKTTVRPTFARPAAPGHRPAESNSEARRNVEVFTAARVVSRPPPRERTGDTWITTYSGQEFYPAAPDIEKIRIGDIAHALSNVCRYTGHGVKFYSVAEHSLRVLWYVESLRFAGASPTDAAQLKLSVARWALMHDATEAYLLDVPAPLKRLPEFAGYLALERQLERAIAIRFSLGAKPAEVMLADVQLLASEWPVVWAHLPTLPRIATDGKRFPPARADLVDGLGWSPVGAEAAFLAAADRLGLR